MRILSHGVVRILGMWALAAVMITDASVETAHAASDAVMTYIRYNRYGSDIYVSYCQVAESYDLAWSQLNPATEQPIWSRFVTFGAINGCTTKYLFAKVADGELLGSGFNLRGNGKLRSYYFQLRSLPGGKIACDRYHVDTPLVRDTRYRADTAAGTACAYVVP